MEKENLLPAFNCRSCGKECMWIEFDGKNHLVDRKEGIMFTPFRWDGKGKWRKTKGHISHFVTCPDRDKWRKK